ncbi:MAG: hypothetical protein NZ920_05750 [Aigarchaeota archaeon]|nr:hypothetical protein [Aigarchaeota archaeon]MDW8092610.1 archaellin/type IV pilin N-terminal domain-containing protein [Nitrososphaerota archaeon]
MKNQYYNKNTRRGVTGLETAIILISFVIVASAFAFAVLNLGFFTTQKSGEVLMAGLDEASTGIELSGSVIARGTSGGQVANISIFIKTSVGKKPIDMRVGNLSISYRDPYIFIPNVYTSSNVANNRVSVQQVTGDGDNLLEYGETWRIVLAITDLTQLRPNDVFAAEIKPTTGSILKVERRLPPSIDLVMDLG